jgi:hypothetical protein
LTNFTNPDTRDKNAYERIWVQEAAIRSLTGSDSQQWQRNANISRVYFGLGYDFVSWQEAQGRAKIIDSFQITSAQLLRDRTAYHMVGHDFTLEVDHNPVRIPDTNFFVWVPYFHEVRCTPSKTGGSYMSMSLCISQPDSPTRGRPDLQYLTTRQVYNREWALQAPENNTPT